MENRQDEYRGQYNNPQSLHRYGYVSNDPIGNWDAYGYVSIREVINAITSPGSTLDAIGTANAYGCNIGDTSCVTKKIEECYQSDNVDCVYDLYDHLADGADIKGYDLASKMMHNFLSKSGDEVSIKEWDFIIDSNVRKDIGIIIKNVQNDIINDFSGRCSDDISYADSFATSADGESNPNLWYAIGRFHLNYEATVKIEPIKESDTSKINIKFNFTVNDRYDWHPEENLVAGGSEEGISLVKDEWGQYLVDKNMASEFNMTSEWSIEVEYIADKNLIYLSDSKTPIIFRN